MVGFECTRPCFANKMRGVCGILVEPAFQEDGTCHFQKEHQDVTKGVRYPYNPYHTGSAISGIRDEDMHKSMQLWAEDWDETVGKIMGDKA